MDEQESVDNQKAEKHVEKELVDKMYRVVVSDVKDFSIVDRMVHEVR